MIQESGIVCSCSWMGFVATICFGQITDPCRNQSSPHKIECCGWPNYLGNMRYKNITFAGNGRSVRRGHDRQTSPNAPSLWYKAQTTKTFGTAGENDHKMIFWPTDGFLISHMELALLIYQRRSLISNLFRVSRRTFGPNISISGQRRGTNPSVMY